jgi:large subunit ribosomal protein L5
MSQQESIMQQPEEESTQHPLRAVRIDKVTLNIATGKSGEPLERAKKVLTQLTNHNPATMRAKKAIKDWGVRRGEPIAAVVTLRGEDANNFLKRALEAVSNRINETAFDDYGNVSFGIKEHIEIPGAKYVPELGIFGATVHVTLARPGYRVKRRSIRPARLGKSHYVSHDDAVRFMQDNFAVRLGGTRE